MATQEYLPATIDKQSTAVTVVGSRVPDVVHHLKLVRQTKEEVDSIIDRYQATTDKKEQKLLDTVKALYEGRVLISLSETFSNAKSSYRYPMLPALAFGSPRARKVTVVRRGSGLVEYHSPRKIFETDMGFNGDGHRYTAVTPIPVAPREIREKFNLKDRSYRVLFEANWSRLTDRAPRPALDPALIQQVAGDLWAVLAVWELTALEAAVLGG
jgi:hypothetical protein